MTRPSREQGTFNALPNNLLQLRERATKTRRQLAEEIGVRYETIWRWEKMQCGIDPRRQPAIAKALNCAVGDIYRPSEPDTGSAIEPRPQNGAQRRRSAAKPSAKSVMEMLQQMRELNDSVRRHLDQIGDLIERSQKTLF